MPFLLVQKVYLSAGVAIRRATTTSTNMYLPSLKNALRLPISSKIADVESVRFMKYGLFLLEFLQQFSNLF